MDPRSPAAVRGLVVLEDVNTVFWVTGNLIAASIFVSGLAFAIIYPILFNPSLTTAGKYIWRAIFSVGGFGFLAVVGTFVDGRVEWFELPPDVDWWRPAIRLVIYGIIAYTFWSLVALLFVRRFHPERLRTAPEDTLNVKPRHIGKP